MKNLFYIALFGMVALMSQSCGGADNKNSDSETTESVESVDTLQAQKETNPLGELHFQIKPDVSYSDFSKTWKFTVDYIILSNDTGEYLLYDDANGEIYDTFAFAFFCVYEVVSSYMDSLDCNFKSEEEAYAKWDEEYAPQIEPYLELCFNMPIAVNVCPKQIQEWFNKAYYNYKDKGMYLDDSGYGFRHYKFPNTGLGNLDWLFSIYRIDKEEDGYDGALAFGTDIDWNI